MCTYTYVCTYVVTCVRLWLHACMHTYYICANYGQLQNLALTIHILLLMNVCTYVVPYTATTAQRWYSWGPTQEQCRLCNFCMVYWRKYGGLKLPTKWGVFQFQCDLVHVQACFYGTAHGLICSLTVILSVV